MFHRLNLNKKILALQKCNASINSKITTDKNYSAETFMMLPESVVT